MNLLIKAFDLSNKIINREYTKDNWKSILDDIATLFEVDGAFIGLWEKGVIKFKHSSYLMESKFPKSKFPELYEVPLNERKHFYNKLKTDGFIRISNYQCYKYALEPWIKIGLKSLLAVAIKTQNKIYGSLHLINLTEKKRLSNNKIEILKKIANAIASELEKQLYIQQIENEKWKNEKQLEFLGLLDNQTEQRFSAEFIIETLKKIKKMLKAKNIEFLFASEDLYIELNNKCNLGSLSSSKGTEIYEIWKNNEKTIKTANIKNNQQTMVFVPIVSAGRVVAVFKFVFIEKIMENFKKDLRTLQLSLTHLVSIMHTYKNIKTVASKLSETEEGLIKAFVSVTEAKDVYTKGHSEHVALYSKIIAKKLGLDINQQEMLYNAGLLHDIGKIGIPDMILLKPRRLTEFEFEIIKYHPVISYEIIKNVPRLKTVANCIRHHHEKMDGSGYPDGLKGDQIELGARILAIADIFDALTTNRPYKKSIPPDKAIEIIRKEKIDQEILSKVEDDLIKGFIKETTIKKTYIPEEIEKIRNDIVEIDFMTGLKRRSYLIKKVEELISAKRFFSLIMIDIKNMSYINYKYGREVGDRIIIFVAETLKKIENKTALSRIGADSFMFLYLDCDANSFKNTLEKQLKEGIMKRIKSKSCIIDKEEAEKIIGCHITFAVYPKEGKSAEELMYICSLKKKKEAYESYVKLFN